MKEVGEFLRNWGPAIFVVAQVVMNVMIWKLSGRFATRGELERQGERVDAHDTRLGDVEGKVLLIENELDHLPTSKDLCELKESIATLNQTCKTLSISTKRFEDYLIKKGQP